MDYASGLSRLAKYANGREWDKEFLVLEARLAENLRNERLYGSSELARRERAEMVDSLNRLAMFHIRKSFNELCGISDKRNPARTIDHGLLDQNIHHAETPQNDLSNQTNEVNESPDEPRSKGPGPEDQLLEIEESNSGVTLSSEGAIDVGGDVAGRDIVKHYHHPSSPEMTTIQLRSPFPNDGYAILDVTAILGATIAQLNVLLGNPEQIVQRGLGSANDIPRGGQTRMYARAGIRFQVNSDYSGVARGIELTEGLKDLGVCLDNWHSLLSKFGIQIGDLPDLSSPMMREWSNIHGFCVRILSDDKQHLNISMLHVFEVPK